MNNNEQDELSDEQSDEEFQAEHEHQLALGNEIEDDHVGRLGDRLSAEYALPFPNPIRIEVLQAHIREAFEQLQDQGTADCMLVDGVVGEADERRNGADEGVAPMPDMAQQMIDRLRNEADERRAAEEAANAEAQNAVRRARQGEAARLAAGGLPLEDAGDSDRSIDSEDASSVDEYHTHLDDPPNLERAPDSRICQYCCDDVEDIEESGGAWCDNFGGICGDCVVRIFDEASTKENKYPAKYRGHRLRTETYRDMLPDEVLKRYLKVKESRTTFPYLRIWCHEQYLGAVELDAADNIRCTAACPIEDCGKIFCKRCKKELANEAEAATHLNCEFDMEAARKARDAPFKGLIRGKDVQFCPRCWRADALKEACNHMTCECGGQYCFPCGKQTRPGEQHWGVSGGCRTYPNDAMPPPLPGVPAMPDPNVVIGEDDKGNHGDDADAVAEQDRPLTGLDLLAAAAERMRNEDIMRDAARLEQRRAEAFANDQGPRLQVGGLRLPGHAPLANLPPPARAGRDMREWQRVAMMLEAAGTAGDLYQARMIRRALANGQDPEELPPPGAVDDEDVEMEDAE
nr:hypothetical protein B0A51_00181 [Rachicladosporium sp. CCFEE 5018]